MKWRVDINKTPLQGYSICIGYFAQPNVHLVHKQVHCYSLKTIHYSGRRHTSYITVHGRKNFRATTVDLDVIT